MGCNHILERHCRVVAVLMLTLGVNGPCGNIDLHKMQLLEICLNRTTTT